MASRIGNQAGNQAGSLIVAQPPLQGLNRDGIRQITGQVKEVHNIERKSNDWKNLAVNAAITMAVALALIGLGVAFNVGFAIGIGAALVVYGAYLAYKAKEKSNAQNGIELVHEDAVVQRVSEQIEMQQLQQPQPFRPFGAGQPFPSPYPQPYPQFPYSYNPYYGQPVAPALPDQLPVIG